MNKIGIIGGGVWGSALAKLLSRNKVLIYARDTNIVSSINEHRINPKLKYVIFNDNVSSTSDIKDLHNYDYIFLALPSQNIREVMKEYSNKNKNQNIIIASKGIEIQSKLLLHDVIKAETNNSNISIYNSIHNVNTIAIG